MTGSTETITENLNWKQHRSADSGEPSPNRYISLTAPASLAQGTAWKRSRKTKSQKTKKTEVKQCLLEMVA